MWRLFLLVFLISFTAFEDSAGQECGRVRGSARLTGKIVGGYDVGYYKYPWFAALLLDGTPWCGGTLIGENAVVTAAHCYKKYLNQPESELKDVFTVKLGIYQSCKQEKTQKEYKAKEVIVHENYIKKDPYFDIAIIILDGDSKNYEPACLPPRVLSDKDRGKEAYIIGLGTMNFSQDSYPCDLYEGRVLLYDDKTCKNMIKHTTDDKEDYPMTNAFCAGYKSGGVDACQGDSGGPILIIEPGGRYILLGLTSFGYECAVKDQMGLYTDVSKYLDWIEEKTGVKSRLIPAVTTNPPDFIDSDSDFPFPFNASEFLPSDSSPPMVYQEDPSYDDGNSQVYYPGYNQQITNGNPYQQLQQVTGNRRPTRIIIEFKKRRKTLGHRRKLHRPHRRRFIYKKHGQRRSTEDKNKKNTRSKSKSNHKNKKKTPDVKT